MKKIMGLSIACVLILTLLAGCTNGNTTLKEKDGTPARVTVWTYYNGSSKDAFDELVEEFNATVGKEKNIMVDAYSQGDVNQLADTVIAAANEDVGSQPMPNIFAAYSDNAFVIDKMGMVAEIEKYFTQEELDSYYQDFLNSGRWGEENKVKIIPVAKSTENLYINVTDFNKFAGDAKVTLDDLKTWEGIANTAKKYYNWTDEQTAEKNDGKAFFGLDSFANFVLIANMQLGNELYEVKNDNVTVNLPKDTAKKIWDNVYVPYVNGYYASIGRFRSDDAKTGDLIAYVGSTAGSAFFPQKVELGKDNAYEITAEVMPYPYFSEGELVTIQQGAGMVIVKSDDIHEQASAIFLKWFTDTNQSAKFAVQTNYLPVKNDALIFDFYKKNSDEILTEFSTTNMAGAKATYGMLDEYSFYYSKPFETSFDARKVVDSSLFDFINADLEVIKERTAAGEDKQKVIDEFINEVNFNRWYEVFLRDLNAIINK